MFEIQLSCVLDLTLVYLMYILVYYETRRYSRINCKKIFEKKALLIGYKYHDILGVGKTRSRPYFGPFSAVYWAKHLI